MIWCRCITSAVELCICIIKTLSNETFSALFELTLFKSLGKASVNMNRIKFLVNDVKNILILCEFIDP